MKNALRQWTVVQPIVSSFVTAMVRDYSARDDLMQDIAIAILESYDRYDPSQLFAAWAIGIARNHVRLYFRTVHRDKLRFSDSIIDLLSEDYSKIASHEIHRLEYLQTCLDKLDARAKELCRARYTENQKPHQIAQWLGGSPNGVAKTLQRIRQQLKQCIERQVQLDRGAS
ncbi:MAG: sigma-70 family RNA polymerase sigma factor [Planctomycetota bacterium]